MNPVIYVAFGGACGGALYYLAVTLSPFRRFRTLLTLNIVGSALLGAVWQLTGTLSFTTCAAAAGLFSAVTPFAAVIALPAYATWPALRAMVTRAGVIIIAAIAAAVDGYVLTKIGHTVYTKLS
jgi:fluoride ion exporter CrcB/FEX